MARPEKVATVDEIKGKLEEARAAVLTEYRGLKVSELAALRASLRAADAEYKVYKNTLARRAAEEAGLSDVVEPLDRDGTFRVPRRASGRSVNPRRSRPAGGHPPPPARGAISNMRRTSRGPVAARCRRP